jgi:hypothetical protein
MLVLIRCEAFCQKTILTKGDTLIAYNLTQNDFIIKGLREWKYYKQAYSICEKQNFNNIEIVKTQMTLLKNDSLDIVNFKKIIDNKNEELDLKQYECDKAYDELQEVYRKLDWQKFYKWTAILIGGSLSGYLGYKYITK